MELRNLGRSGLRVSTIGLGCNNFGGRIGFEESRAIIHKALDEGITLLTPPIRMESAEVSKTVSDECLGTGASKSSWPRSSACLWTIWGLGRRRHAATLCPRSRTACVGCGRIGSICTKLVRFGKVRYIGCSNFPAWQVVEAVHTSRAEGLSAFISCQDEYSLLVRRIEQELMPAAERYGLGVLPYLPLASGVQNVELGAWHLDAGDVQAVADIVSRGVP